MELLSFVAGRNVVILAHVAVGATASRDGGASTALGIKTSGMVRLGGGGVRLGSGEWSSLDFEVTSVNAMVCGNMGSPSDSNPRGGAGIGMSSNGLIVLDGFDLEKSEQL